MFSTLRFRLVMSHLTVILLAMLLSGVLLLSLFEQYFIQATENSLIAQAQITAQAFLSGDNSTMTYSQTPLNNAITQQQSNLYLTAPYNSLESRSVQLGAQLTTRIRILDADGTLILDSTAAQTIANLSDDPLVQQALSGATVRHIEDNIISLVFPVESQGKLTGIVYLSQPLDDIIAVLHDLRGRWMLSTGIGVLLSAVVGLVLSQVIVNPVRRLTTAVEAVASGDFDHKVNLKSRDELGRLSVAFNEMTDRLRAARQIQTDFVANVSHELRTPLTSIKTMIETLRGGAVDDLDARDSFLETIESETNRLIRLVNDLLLLTRADSHALNLRCQPVNLADLVRNVIKPLTQTQPEQPIALSVPDDLTVSADRDRVAQVMVNLLDNALKYSQGKITISAHPNGSHDVHIAVRDTGGGISPADLPRIGQRFYRTDKARSRLQGGSGLGLAIAIALVEAHGGKLWVESCESAGTTVNFTLHAIS